MLAHLMLSLIQSLKIVRRRFLVANSNSSILGVSSLSQSLMSHFNIRMCQYNSELSLLAHAHSQLEVSDLVLVLREFDKLLINSKYAEITTISSAKKIPAKSPPIHPLPAEGPDLAVLLRQSGHPGELLSSILNFPHHCGHCFMK